LHRGQVRLVQGGGAANLQLIQALSDSEEEHDSAWDGRLGDRYNPPVDATPDTGELEYNEIKTQVELATGRLGLRRTAQSLQKLSMALLAIGSCHCWWQRLQQERLKLDLSHLFTGFGFPNKLSVGNWLSVSLSLFPSDLCCHLTSRKQFLKWV
ncbi:DDB1- and CUL4-associated factor 11, partial [Lemmus lemmus]